MTGVLAKALRDIRRRRLQVAVVFVTTLLAVGTGTIALTLIAQTSDPYQTAFEAQKGAHLVVDFDGRVDPGALAGTPAAIGASAFAGPYRASDMQFQSGGHKYTVTTIARDNPGGDVGQLRITGGRWPSNGKEIALTRSFADLNHVSIGDRLRVLSVPEAPSLTVVGLVVDIDELRADVGGQQHAWFIESAFASLTTKGASFYQMDYRFASDPTSAQVQAHLTTLRASLPPDSITGSISYIFARTVFHISTEILTGVLVAFSVFALAATAAIVAHLVAGRVISAYREIGIMKAVGFTPTQVIGVFVLQILVPTADACLVGIPGAMVLSQPLLASNSQALGLAYQPTYSPVLGLLALAGALLIVTVAAMIPAFRAGRLKPAIVIANASAPRGQSGRWLRRVASMARLPRPMVLGLGDSAARAGGGLLTLLAVVLGVATVVVALGETRTFNEIYSYEGHIGKVDVVVAKSPALADAAATQLIASQPETRRVVAQASANITAHGIADPVNTLTFRGDSAALGFLLTSGRWFSGPGEVGKNGGFLQGGRQLYRDGQWFGLEAANRGRGLRLHRRPGRPHHDARLGDPRGVCPGPVSVQLHGHAQARFERRCLRAAAGGGAAGPARRPGRQQRQHRVPQRDRSCPVGHRRPHRADRGCGRLQHRFVEHPRALARHRHPQNARDEPATDDRDGRHVRRIPGAGGRSDRGAGRRRGVQGAFRPAQQPGRQHHATLVL